MATLRVTSLEVELQGHHLSYLMVPSQVTTTWVLLLVLLLRSMLLVLMLVLVLSLQHHSLDR